MAARLSVIGCWAPTCTASSFSVGGWERVWPRYVCLGLELICYFLRISIHLSVQIPSHHCFSHLLSAANVSLPKSHLNPWPTSTSLSHASIGPENLTADP